MFLKGYFHYSVGHKLGGWRLRVTCGNNSVEGHLWSEHNRVVGRGVGSVDIKEANSLVADHI